ncbi:MAG: hypothetical protein EA401_04345 [Planctomycetota bacterium]|nr:MAG: hypothetical protein EA401_04345 [Planctomycetota bacterium]
MRMSKPIGYLQKVYGCALAIAITFSGSPYLAANEPVVGTAVLQGMDDWELSRLRNADEAFNNNRWRQAAAAYELFLTEFPGSSASAHVIYRLARSHHEDKKINEARVFYRDILDFFPDAVPFAAAAYYHLGKSHDDAGAHDEAIRIWAEMAQDERYINEPLGGSALNRLSGRLIERDRWGEAIDNLQHVAVHFRTENRRAADWARDRAFRYWVREQPDQDAVRAFWIAARGTNGRRDVPDSADGLEEHGRFWSDVRSMVFSHDRHWDDGRAGEQERAQYLNYWVQALQGRLLDSDDHHLDRIELERRASGDQAAYFAALRERFARGDESDQQRNLRFLRLVQEHSEELRWYYQRMDVRAMDFATRLSLLETLVSQGEDEGARSVLSRFPLADLEDGQLIELAQAVFGWNQERAESVLGQVDDTHAGNYALLNLYAGLGRDSLRDAIDRIVELADSLVASPDHASSAQWIKGQKLEAVGRYTEAIAAYRAADRGTDTGFAVARCLRSDGRLEQALSELEMIENVVPDDGPRAARTAAEYLLAADREEAAGRVIIRIQRQYRGSREANWAHRQGERLGLDYVDGVEAE